MARSRSRTPARGKSPAPPSKVAEANKSYKSDGVEDNDVFLLPGSDYILMLGVTVLAAAVRIFKISQPTSVVFDEVQ